MIALSIVALTLVTQQGYVAVIDRHGSFLSRTDAIRDIPTELTSLFKRDRRGSVADSKIRLESRSFSSEAIRSHVRSDLPAIAWNGFLTVNGQNEVMAATWNSSAGRCLWTDNGLTVTILCELNQAIDLIDVETTQTFVEETLQKFLDIEPVDQGDIEHRLKVTEGTPALWSGVFTRKLPMVEETQADGSVRIRLLRKAKWHEYLTVATDGRVFVVSFNLSEPQKHPLGVSATPGRYVPFRFRP